MSPAGDAPENETLRRVHQFGFSITLFERNRAELALFLEYLTDPAVSAAILPQDERWRRKEALGEVQFLLHNFVAAAMSLVDHTRVFYNEIYAPKNLMASYQAEITSRFADDPLSQFVKCLRQMAQHYRLPNPGISVQFSKAEQGHSLRTELSIKKDDLESFSGWTKPARTYIATAPDAIDISALVKAYSEHIAAFYAWFSSEQHKIHGKAPAIWAHLVTHGIASPQDEVVGSIERSLSGLEKKPKASLTFEEIREALSPAMTILDQRQLMYCIYQPLLWRDHALARIQTRFKLPPELLARLNRLFERDA
jgi:hypothetical protein